MNDKMKKKNVYELILSVKKIHIDNFLIHGIKF